MRFDLVTSMLLPQRLLHLDTVFRLFNIEMSTATVWATHLLRETCTQFNVGFSLAYTKNLHEDLLLYKVKELF